MFWGLDILTIMWVTRDLPEECRYLLNTQLFLKKKDPTSKQFDFDEWIRSLADAQEVTTDDPEDSVIHDQQVVDPKKVRSIQTGEFLWKYVSRRLLLLTEGEIVGLTTSVRQIGVGTPGGAGVFGHLPSAPFLDDWMTGSHREPLARSKVDEKICFGMNRARGGFAVPPRAHGSSNVETSEPVLC